MFGGADAQRSTHAANPVTSQISGVQPHGESG